MSVSHQNQAIIEKRYTAIRDAFNKRSVAELEPFYSETLDFSDYGKLLDQPLTLVTY